MRIVSLVPGATEIVLRLGAVDELVGITYACEDLVGRGNRKLVVKPRVDTEGMSAREINQMMNEIRQQGLSPYVIDVQTLKELRPDVVFCQSLCEVCAVIPDDIMEALATLSPRPRVVDLHPHDLNDIMKDVVKVASAIGRRAEGEELKSRMSSEIESLMRLTVGTEEKRTFFIEWPEPAFCSGHWVPDMISRVNGIDLGELGKPSRPVREDEVDRHSPDVIIFGPCGFNLNRAMEELLALYDKSWFTRQPAVLAGEVYAVDAKRYFSSHGVSVVDGVKVLAEILHPRVVKGVAPPGSFMRSPI
ncbi:MAG: ABC transporter substrate-binding protein [Aigarchaeota archaeon]|nr:ABC transporter substrate-binding protein [Aigarchaeota archaeon]MDW8092676.1 ABC transporter substrate-binding protein [Nitrososphaerota archaeon]